MDAVKFLKEKNRMCKSINKCGACALSDPQNYCDDFAYEHPEEAVSIIEAWAKAHPAKTRQSEFLKLFPNAPLRDGVLTVCPRCFIPNMRCEDSGNCAKCSRDFWMMEIES